VRVQGALTAARYGNGVPSPSHRYAMGPFLSRFTGEGFLRGLA